jgi:hypothetical protein
MSQDVTRSQVTCKLRLELGSPFVKSGAVGNVKSCPLAQPRKLRHPCWEGTPFQGGLTVTCLGWWWHHLTSQHHGIPKYQVMSSFKNVNPFCKRMSMERCQLDTWSILTSLRTAAFISEVPARSMTLPCQGFILAAGEYWMKLAHWFYMMFVAFQSLRQT